MRARFTPIGVTKDLVKTDRLQRAVENTLRASALAMRVDFNVTTQTWRNRPEFAMQIAPDGVSWASISTNDEIYGYVNYGTRPHRIEPKNAPALRFQAGYKSKTMPRVIASRQGGSFGPVVYSQGVNHPGTQGRFFDRAIAQKWEREWPRNLQRSISAIL